MLRPTDVFVVSYPKSGTNWVRFFLASLLAGEEGAGRNGSGEEKLTLRTYRSYVPDLNKAYFRGRDLAVDERAADPRFFTLHAPYDARLPRVVYLVRDPRDVMVSYYHHRRRSRKRFDQTLEAFVRRKHIWPCDWGAHVGGWLDHAGPQVLFVRYEDLKADPHAAFRRIVDFAGLDVSDERLARAVAASSFDNMRRLEGEHGTTRVPDKPEIPYTRKGRVGGWRDELGEALVQLLEERYAEPMERLGYARVHASTP